MGLRGWMLGVVTVLVLAVVVPARAQLALYGEFTGASPQQPNEPDVYGGTFGFYGTRRLGLVAVGPDFRGSVLRHGNTNGDGTDEALDFGLGGLRLAVTPHILPIMPYVEALGGISYYRLGQGSARQDTYSGAAQFLAGVDYTLLPRIDWRVIEFSYGHIAQSAGAFNPETLSTGVVIRLP